MGDFFEQRRFDDNFHFIGFATEKHPAINNLDNSVKIITIKSDRRDAADTLMIGYASKLVHMDIYSEINDIYNGDDIIHVEILIVTKDHFGPSLVDYINNHSSIKLPIGSITAYSIKDLEELIEYFKSRNH